MASTVPQNLLAVGVIQFAFRDGTTGSIAPEARRIYDHIIGFRIGNFPSNGLTDTQAKLILSASRLPESDLETIWQRTGTIDAPGLPDGYWTQLEIYVALHFAQASEKLSLEEMAIQFADSTPQVTTYEIRRMSSYAEAGLTLRPGIDHGPMRVSPRPPSATLMRHSTSNATMTIGTTGHHINQATLDRDDASVSQPGLEILQNPRTDTSTGAQKLASLIHSRCPNVQIDPDIERFQPRPIESSIADRLDARDLLIRKRREDPKFKDSTKRLGKVLKPKLARQNAADSGNWVFKGHELSLALREVVEISGNVGIAKALIDDGADVNSFKQASKSRLGVSRIDSIPINYTKIAVHQNNTDMVSLFATSTVSQNYLVEALEQAVEQNLPNIVLILLQHGVDPNSCEGSIFASAVASQNPALVRLLLRSRSKIRQDLLSSNLPTAAEQGQTEIVSMLVKHGADISFANASALRKAVHAQSINLVLTILKGVEGVARSDIASSVIAEAFSATSSLTVPEQWLLIHILLCAGANGDPVAQILTPVVRAGHQCIAKLLIEHGADLQYKNAEALRIAIATDNLHMLSTLLLGRTTKEVVSSAVDETPHNCGDDRTYSILSLLIAKGANGPPLDRALVRAVQRKSYKTVGLLLDHEASVDVQRSQPLRMAVTGADMPMVNLLLSRGRPQPRSMEHLLPLIPNSPPHVRFHMTKSIINAAGQDGIAVSVLNDALAGALRYPSHEVDQCLVPLVDVLVTAGASVDHHQGKCFRLAAEVGSMGLLELLIRNMSEPASLSPAVQVCMKWKGSIQRQKFVGTLLEHGAKGSEVNQALIDAIQEESTDKILVQFLLEKADLEYLGGRALCTATRCSSVELVAAIINTEKTSRKNRLDAAQILFQPGTKERRAKLSLLIRAGVGQGVLDRALIQEISGERDGGVVKMLLDHEASCEYDGGKSIKLAVRCLDDQILEQLIARQPDHHILENVIPEATGIKNVISRRTCLGPLLRGGARGESVSHALIQEVETPGYRDHQIIHLLVEHGARIDYSNARAIKFAVSSPLEVEILKILASGMAASAVLASLIPLAMTHDQKLRLPLLHILLGNGACGAHVNAALVTARKPEALNSPLIQAVQEKDYDLIELLINSGADPNFRDGMSMIIATQQLNTRSLYLLARSKTKPTPQTCSRAFCNMPKDRDRWQNEPELIHDFDNILIPGGAAGTAVDQTFLSAVRSSHALAAKFVSMVLRCQTALNVNFEGGKSLCIVVRGARLDILDYMLSQGPNEPTLRAAFMAIFESGAEELTLIALAHRFFDHSGRARHIYFRPDEPANDALYQTLHRHGNKPSLLQTLFDNGCGSETRLSWEFYGSYGAEQTSALLWLLCQGHESIDSRTLNIFLERGADPNFRTSKSGTTPLTVAASSARAEIILRLLQAGALPDTQDSADRTPLQYATTASTIEGMDHLIKYKAEVDDESLHIAARQLDLPAVKLLLDHHAQADLPGTIHCGGRTPLGELCRMANLNHNPPQLKKTLAYLCKATTRLGVRIHGKSLLLQAIDNNSSLKMTTALLTSCQPVRDGLNDDLNVFSNGSLRYSPTAYVRHFKCAQFSRYRSLDFSGDCCTLADCPAPKLEELLHAYGCKDGFWDANAGANQPKGLCNPPPAITTAIEDAEAARKEEARKARDKADEKLVRERAEAEERARIDRHQRDLDAAAAADLRRERERLKVLEEGRDAERRARKERTKAEDREYNIQRERERAEFDDQQERERRRNQALRERSNIQIDQKKKEANIRKDLIKQEKSMVGEKRKLVDCAAEMFREAGYLGISKDHMGGKVLGEITE
ncbi:MAG: hypothetical protein Q9163_000644 [Psora crenata]